MHRDLIEFWKNASEDHFDALLDHAPILMQATDASGRFHKVSRLWAELLGHSPEALAGTPWISHVAAGERGEIAARMASALAETGTFHNAEVTFRSASGEDLPVLLSATALKDKDGRILRTYAILFDNRAVIETRNQLEAAVAAAENASRAKSRFLAAMSHEIRTPMNAIMGFAQLLKMSRLDERRASHVEAIITAGGALMNLLTDLLDLSQVEEGKMRIELRDFDLIALLDQVADWWHSSAKQKGLRLTITLDRSLPRRVVSEPLRLQQILNNFLSNAVKFTEAGSVTLRVLLVGEADGKARLRIEVEDTGPGMRPHEIQRLFKPFVQIESDFGKERGGWGLGLSICNNIAQRLDADIGVVSTPGKGTTFHFELDVGIPEIQTAPSPAPEPARRQRTDMPLKILVAEDDAPSQELMETLLQELGHTVETVGNGFEAVEAAMRDHYDLILMDIMMPGLDGIAAAEQIRSGENGSHDAPIIACSAHVAPEAQKRYLSLGMNAFLPKPVDPEELAAMIRTVAGPRPEPADA